MLIDLTQTICDSQPIFPGDNRTILNQSQAINSDGYNNHDLSTSMHSGTHIDIPLHFTNDARSMDDWPLERFIGRGYIIDYSTASSQSAVFNQNIPYDSIVVLHTGWSARYLSHDYFDAYPVLDLAIADLLIQRRVKMLAIDAPSPDKYPFDIHRALLENNILIAENLCHTEALLELESFEIIALPLKIRAAGSIARIIARSY